MKFLCIDCDRRMDYFDRRQPGDGTFAAAFECPGCGHRVAMLANPMETQLVDALGVQVGGRTLDPEPFELVRGRLVGGEEALAGVAPPGPQGLRWSPEGVARLERVPGFVRAMVKKIYSDWARERGIDEITPAVMDEARADLGLEGM